MIRRSLFVGTIAAGAGMLVAGAGMIAASAMTACGTANRAATAAQPQASKEEPAGKGDSDRSLDMHGTKRTYRVHVPASYDKSKPAPLVLAFHGRHGQGADQEKLSHLNDVSDKNGFIVTYPDGVGESWNAGHGTGEAQKQNVDDVAFVRRLIEALQADFNIDPRRIYATGMSNGAVFSHRLGCELADKIAAIAPVEGTIAPPIARICKPSRPIAMLEFHGTGDRITPYKGGETKGGGTLESVDDTFKLWRERDKCPSDGKVTFEKGDVTCKTHGPCEAGTEVTMCTVDDGGHTWPGGFQYLPRVLIGKTSESVDASTFIWEFFSRHPMPEK